MSIPFELAGRFGGFVFTDAGKRRMLLRCGEETRLLKVPRLLRRRIIGKFGPGEPIRVAGTQEQEPETGVLKEVVSRVLPTDGGSAAVAAPAPCVVRVCAKKNCWRQGGRELWETLSQQDNVTLEQVGCLDHCKQAPNIECGHRVYSRCTPRDATNLISQTAGND